MLSVERKREVAEDMKSFDFVESYERWNGTLGRKTQVKGYLRLSKWFKERIKQGKRQTILEEFDDDEDT